MQNFLFIKINVLIEVFSLYAKMKAFFEISFLNVKLSTVQQFYWCNNEDLFFLNQLSKGVTYSS